MLLNPVLLSLCAAGVVGQRAGEERGHRSRRSPHDPHEADRWYVTTVLRGFTRIYTDFLKHPHSLTYILIFKSFIHQVDELSFLIG